MRAEKKGFIDFHCHLDFDNYTSTWKNIVDQCFDDGFSRLVTVVDPYEPDSMEKSLKIMMYHPDVFGVVAVHPHHADYYNDKLENNIIDFCQNQKVVAIGETGLDFHYNYSSAKNQEAVLRRHLHLAKTCQLPLVIHSRSAEREVLRILEQESFPLPVVFHCYTGSREHAREIINRGYFISISGIVTFKKSQLLRDIVVDLPLEKIFTETDSPFLSPEPFRGKENLPLRVKIVAEKVAQLKGISVQELNDAVNKNFNNLFL